MIAWRVVVGWFFFFQAEDGIRDLTVTGVQTCALPICLFGARFLLGIGEAPTFPANAKAIGYWFPKDERSLATAMFDAAAKFSSAIGIPLLGLLLLYFGWRWNFAATGFISLLYFALFYAFYRNPSEDKLLTDAERSEEHTSELQSQSNLVCRLLLEKKKQKLIKSEERWCSAT